jgi:hypothetical protein
LSLKHYSSLYFTDNAQCLTAILILAARDVPQAAEPVAGRPKEALAEVKVVLTGPFCRPAPQARQPVVRKMRIAECLMMNVQCR